MASMINTMRISLLSEEDRASVANAPLHQPMFCMARTHARSLTCSMKKMIRNTLAARFTACPMTGAPSKLVIR